MPIAAQGVSLTASTFVPSAIEFQRSRSTDQPDRDSDGDRSSGKEEALPVDHCTRLPLAAADGPHDRQVAVRRRRAVTI